jgi:hypothetical protein
MKKIILFFTLFAMGFGISSAQAQSNRLIPVEVQKAYANKTRSKTGVPGPKYWENHAKYTIHAELLAAESSLKGKETVIYKNNSPDTLKRLVIRLYQDFYKKGAARAWNIGPADLTDGVQIDYIKINGQNVKMPEKQYGYFFGTNRYVALPQPLAPGQSVELSAGWRFHIPTTSRNRMGNYGKGRFFIAYWYPQISVYDDISGWDQIAFNGITEFYNDFNDYDVTLVMPKGYAVWATGHLDNAEGVFSKPVMKRLEEVKKSDKIIPVITQKDWKRNNVLQSKGPTVWHFTADGVTDFSFAATLRYNWDASSVLVDTVAGRRVRVDAIYPDSSHTFQRAAYYARKSVEFMSFRWPGYRYPYEHMTSFSNGTPNGGMETPMMANDGDPKDTVETANLVFHEISHSYFPFFMGTNERKYAWMDEGWAAYFTGLFSAQRAPEYPYFQRIAQRFSQTSGREMEMPLMIPSNLICNFNYYRVQAYTRSSLAYRFLRDALGDSLFKKALHAYIVRWNGKHPIPFDFINTFRDVTKQNLMWFFKPWFFGPGYADLAIKAVTLKHIIVIENKGGLPLPVNVVCKYSDGTTEVFSKSTAVWNKGQQSIRIQANISKKINKVMLGASHVPDVDKSNNIWVR